MDPITLCLIAAGGLLLLSRKSTPIGNERTTTTKLSRVTLAPSSPNIRDGAAAPADTRAPAPGTPAPTKYAPKLSLDRQRGAGIADSHPSSLPLICSTFPAAAAQPPPAPAWSVATIRGLAATASLAPDSSRSWGTALVPAPVIASVAPVLDRPVPSQSATYGLHGYSPIPLGLPPAGIPTPVPAEPLETSRPKPLGLPPRGLGVIAPFQE